MTYRDLAEDIFLRSSANDPTPLSERTTSSILDEIAAGADWLWMEQLCAEILTRCATYEEARA